MTFTCIMEFVSFIQKVNRGVLQPPRGPPGMRGPPQIDPRGPPPPRPGFDRPPGPGKGFLYQFVSKMLITCKPLLPIW